jgi:hypothetical protein
MDLPGFLVADDCFFQRYNAGGFLHPLLLAAAAPLFAAEVVIGQVGGHPQEPPTEVALIPGRLVVQLEEDLLGQVLGCRPLSQEIIEAAVYPGIVGLKQRFKFSRFDGPSPSLQPLLSI